MVTPEELQVILTTHAQVQECQKALLNGLAGIVPSVVPILTKYYNHGEDELLLLVQREINWGEFNKRRRDRGAELSAEMQAENQRVTSGLQQRHEAELEQRQRAAAAMAQWAQTQQMINAINRPVPQATFHTMPQSPAVNCISQQIGSQVYTNCQ
jgi:hypothetical protein